MYEANSIEEAMLRLEKKGTVDVQEDIFEEVKRKVEEMNIDFSILENYCRYNWRLMYITYQVKFTVFEYPVVKYFNRTNKENVFTEVRKLMKENPVLELGTIAWNHPRWGNQYYIDEYYKWLENKMYKLRKGECKNGREFNEYTQKTKCS
ncbi:hypothetical protein M5X17_31260 [Paenibacillus alvei]|uniref:hypothetical protein n=1 Tax=Paenibacillus alvei TaxID=44250 RepID=UPI002281328F|nr:hypothetical protein [Paenibacillus alvei]MCY9738173.1 hypothetical protein [Paenibacillus alvei]